MIYIFLFPPYILVPLTTIKKHDAKFMLSAFIQGGAIVLGWLGQHIIFY